MVDVLVKVAYVPIKKFKVKTGMLNDGKKFFEQLAAIIHNKANTIFHAIAYHPKQKNIRIWG